MKVEGRGKYPGVKVHLDPEEVQVLLNIIEDKFVIGTKENFPGLLHCQPSVQKTFNLAYKIGKKIEETLVGSPDLLSERTPEQVAAILAKEVEKAGLQLAHLKAGTEWKKINPEDLQKALLKHVKEK